MQKITKIILRVLSIVIGLPVVAVLLIAALVGVQYLRNDHPIALPAPSGSHPVGRVLLDLRDSARQRELMVFVWYPAESGFAGPPPEYVPGHWGELEAAQMLPIPAMRLRQIRVNSVENAPLAQGNLPVLVFLPGMGRIPAHYTSLAEDLASYGYVIIGVTPTDSADVVVFNDGRIARATAFDPSAPPDKVAQLVDTWAGDASFALDEVSHSPRFRGHLDSQRIGIFGHSFGGNVAARQLQGESRYSRAANIDGAFFGKPIQNFEKPLLLLKNAENDKLDSSICARDAKSCEVVVFPGTRHMSFSDASLLPSRFPIPKSVLLLGDADGAHLLHQVSERLRAFFGEM